MTTIWEQAQGLREAMMLVAEICISIRKQAGLSFVLPA